jgi:CheY-like chemotaxis protein
MSFETAGERMPELNPSSELRTILIVDDTPENITYLSAILKGLYKIKVANGGKRALTLLENGLVPNLILLDVMMPDIDGYAVFKALKKIENVKNVPVVFLTALTDQKNQEKALELGAASYIAKPIDPATVLTCIKEYID